MHVRFVPVLSAVVLAACGGGGMDPGALPDGDTGDAGPRSDGSSPGDAGSERDGGPGSRDGGAPMDASTGMDAEPGVDGDTRMDAGAGTDADIRMDADWAMDGGAGLDGDVDGDSGSAADAAGEDSSSGSDAASGPDAAVPSGDVLWPRVTVEQGAGQADPTSATPIVFDVVFDERIDVGTLEVSDFEITPEVALTAEVAGTGDGRTFEIRLSDLPDVDARYEVDLPYGRVTDLAGNPNEPSVSSDNSVRYDVVLPTVEIRKYPPVVDVANTLPITFQLIFQWPVDAGTFTVSDVSNGGTASGVVWELQALNPGYVYLVRATAVGTAGTVFPVVPQGAATDSMGRANLASVYLGDPVTYTTLPILTVIDAEANEGSRLNFRVQFFGTTTSSTDTTLDWATADGTAVAGVDYVAASGADVTIPAGQYSVSISVDADPDDDLPEPHKDFSLQITNVRGDVYVHDDTGTGTVVNDDRGYWSIGANGEFNPEARPFDIRISGDDIHVFGDNHSGAPSLRRRDLATSTLEQVLGVDGRDAAGLAVNSLGYYFATNTFDGDYQLQKFDSQSDWFDSDFGDYGEVLVSDPVDVLAAVDLTADDANVYVVGKRTDPDGDSRWFIEARDGATGTLVSSFGSSGVLTLDRMTGTTEETPVTVETDGSVLFVLGAIGGAYRVEKRSVTDGALDAPFGAAGVLELPYDSVDDIALHAGKLYVIGTDAGETVVEQYDAMEGTFDWSGWSVVDAPECITATTTGLYIGGSRDEVMHMERWMLDGMPLWAHTFERDRSPGGITDIVYEPGSIWIHSVGYHTTGGDRDWYYDKRYIEDGFRHSYQPGEPPE